MKDNIYSTRIRLVCNNPQLIDILLIILVSWIGLTMLCVAFIVSGFKISIVFSINRTCLYKSVIGSEERTHTYKHVFERDKTMHVCNEVRILQSHITITFIQSQGPKDLKNQHSL